MGVLRFDGVNDKVKSTSLSAALALLGDAAVTVAYLVKFAGSADTDFDALGYLLSGTGNGTAQMGLSLDSTEKLICDIGHVEMNNVLNVGTTVYIVVARKAAGSSTCTYSFVASGGGAWTHATTVGSIARSADATMLEIGAWQGGDFANAWIGLYGAWAGVMSDAQVEALDNNWRTSDWHSHAFGAPKSLIEFNTATPTDLEAGAASLTVTGATLDAAETLASWTFDGTGGGTAYLLDCAPGAYAVTGAAATTARGLFVNAATGTYAVTGSAATTARGLFVTADPGAYAVTGAAASFLKTSVISADPGAYAVTGSAATLAAGRVFSADPGVYEITGVAATLELGTPGVYTLSADAGSYLVAGAAATIPATRLFAADPGAYAVTGTAATVGRELTIAADPGTYTLTGSDTSFLRTLVLSADTGSYTITGSAATLRSEGQAPNMDEILTGWLAGANAGGRVGGSVQGRIRTPVTGGIA